MLNRVYDIAVGCAAVGACSVITSGNLQDSPTRCPKPFIGSRTLVLGSTPRGEVVHPNRAHIRSFNGRMCWPQGSGRRPKAKQALIDGLLGGNLVELDQGWGMLEHKCEAISIKPYGKPARLSSFRARRHGIAPGCAGCSLASTARGSGVRCAALARMAQPDCRVLQVASTATLAHVVDTSTKRQRPVITLDSHSPRLGADLNRQLETAEGGHETEIEDKKQRAVAKPAREAVALRCQGSRVQQCLKLIITCQVARLGACRWRPRNDQDVLEQVDC